MTVKRWNTLPEVAFVIPSLGAGGAERALLNWLRHWPADEALRPIVILRKRTGQLLDQVPADIPVIELGVEGGGPYHSGVAMIRLTRILAKRRPAVVVALLSVPNVVLACRLASNKIKVVASLQNPISGSETGFEPDRKRSPWIPLACGWALRHADQIWAIAPGLADEAITFFRAPIERVRLLPNSVDITLIQSKAAEDPRHPLFPDPETPVIVTACRLAWQKRVDILLEAFALLSAQRTVNLIVLGDGPLRGQLESKARALGIFERAQFLGVRSNPWSFIARASVFVLSSDFEGFGNVLIEAMACGTPVVATRAFPGPEYIISDKHSGLLVPTQDPQALADAMRLFLADSDFRNTCIANGLERAADFDIGKVTTLMTDNLRTLVQ